MPGTEVEYDAIVIGAGQAGGPLATGLARAGRRTALIEREHVGGTCINTGCTPTKTMVASAHVAHLARRAADYGVRTGPVSVDMAKVRQRKRDIVEQFRGGGERRIEKSDGVDLLRGEARFVGPREIEVALHGGETGRLRATRWVFVNTGERPSSPDLPGLDGVPTLDSTSIMELDAVPEHLLVLGGGYIGLEFGQMFRRFGSRVTIVQRGPRLLAREDADVADAVADILREDGIDVLLGTKATRVSGGPNGEIDLVVQGSEGAAERVVRGSHLLLAAGRTPNTDRLNLTSAGVEMNERGYIVANERLETSAAGVYALGDVKGPPAFTHISYDDWRIIRANLLEGGSVTTAERPVPYTVFMDPQLGRVGLTEWEARKQGKNVRVATLPMTSVARALEVDETRGFMKAVLDADTDQILGFAALGIEGGEVMSVVQIAMMGRLPYQVLKEGVFAHPTLSESLNNLFMTLD